jgi:hypothetical protein
MHVPINVKSPNNTSKWQMGFNSVFKRLTEFATCTVIIPKCLKYANVTLFTILTMPSTPAAIPSGLRKGE